MAAKKHGRRSPKRPASSGASAATWGWIAGAVVFVAALVVSFKLLPSNSGSDSPSDGASATEVVRVPNVIDPGRKPLDDPEADGWLTEVWSSKADGQLKALGHLVIHPEKKTAASLSELATESFTCGALLPGGLATVFEESGIQVRRSSSAQEGSDTGHSGPSGLGEALRELSAPFDGASDLHFKFKLFRLRSEGETAVTRQYFALSGQTAEGLLEQNATWEIEWSAGAGEAPPKMKRIRVVDFEQVRNRRGKDALFSDCAGAVLGGNTAYQEQLLFGYNYWLERIQDNRYFSLFGSPGIAVGDVNGDGLEDLYLCQEGGLPNLLFIQNPDGTARDVSAASGANWLESARGVLLVDLDGDGDQDLAVGLEGNLVLAANDGEGHFAVREVLPTTSDTFSLSAADPDADGDLDLYVCAYNRNDLTDDSGVLSLGGEGGEFVYHDANNGGANSYFRNETADPDHWLFKDATIQAGLDVNNRRFSFAAAWEDYDNDGDQDLYVANDFGRNNLYRNDGGTFTDVAAEAGVEDSASGMGVTWADVDHNGWMDVHVSNMFSAAGGRVTYQDAFKPESDSVVRQRLQRFARGNTLLKNQGDGHFVDASEEAAVTMGRWAWSCNFFDANNDGWDDLIVANGYITTPDTRDL